MPFRLCLCLIPVEPVTTAQPRRRTGLFWIGCDRRGGKSARAANT